MAYNAIASGSAILTANADGLKSGLDKAANDVKGWGSKVQGSMGGAAGGKGGMLGSLLGGGGGGLGKALPVLAGVTAGVAAFGFAADKVVDTLGDMAKQGAMAKALGMTSEQFTGIAGVAKSVGNDTKEFVESLVTMGNLGRDAANGTETASAAFKDMGLNAEEFNKLRADEQFLQVFDALGKMTDGGKRTNAMMKAFGEDGGKILLPLLGKSSAELKQMADGFAVTTAEMQKATAASESLKKLEGSLGKLWRSIAVAAAPLVEGFANFATKAIAFVKPFFDWFMRAWAAVEEVAVPFFDMVGAAASELWADIKAGFASAFGWVGELPTIRTTIIELLRGVGVGFALLWDTVKAGAGVVSVALGTIAAGFGVMLAEIPGAEDTAARLKRAGEGMFNWGKAAVTGWGNGARDWNAWLDKALAPKAKGQEIGKALGAGINEGMKLEPLKLSGAVMAGSKEAYSMIVKNNLRGMTGASDPAKKQLDELKKGNGLQQKNNREVAAMRAKLDQLEAV